VQIVLLAWDFLKGTPEEFTIILNSFIPFSSRQTVYRELTVKYSVSFDFEARL
jgi:hypothetical protein